MQEWSGLRSTNSLPAETLQRMGMNARLVEHAARTPQGSVFESFSSRHGNSGASSSPTTSTDECESPSPCRHTPSHRVLSADKQDHQTIAPSAWTMDERSLTAPCPENRARPSAPAEDTRPTVAILTIRRKKRKFTTATAGQSIHTRRTLTGLPQKKKEERVRSTERLKEKYLRTVIRESGHNPDCPLRKWATRKLG